MQVSDVEEGQTLCRGTRAKPDGLAPNGVPSLHNYIAMAATGFTDETQSRAVIKELVRSLDLHTFSEASAVQAALALGQLAAEDRHQQAVLDAMVTGGVPPPLVDTLKAKQQVHMITGQRT